MVETKKLFMAALEYVLGMTDIAQKDIAEKSGIAPQTISNIVRGTKEAGLTSQERIANACGFSLLDFLSIGNDLIEGKEISPSIIAPLLENQEDTQTEKSHYGSNDALLADPKPSPGRAAIHAVTELAEQYDLMERKRRLWRQMFESLIDPVCLLKDGIVVFHNQKARAWGAKKGLPFCDNCLDGNCDAMDNGTACAIRDAQSQGVPAKRIKKTPWGDAVYSCTPFLFEGAEYFVVTACLIKEMPVISGSEINGDRP